MKKPTNPPDEEIQDSINFRANSRRRPELAKEFHFAISDHRSDRSDVLRELLDAYVRIVKKLGRPPKFPLHLKD